MKPINDFPFLGLILAFLIIRLLVQNFGDCADNSFCSTGTEHRRPQSAAYDYEAFGEYIDSQKSRDKQ